MHQICEYCKHMYIDESVYHKKQYKKCSIVGCLYNAAEVKLDNLFQADVSKIFDCISRENKQIKNENDLLRSKIDSLDKTISLLRDEIKDSEQKGEK